MIIDDLTFDIVKEEPYKWSKDKSQTPGNLMVNLLGGGVKKKRNRLKKSSKIR